MKLILIDKILYSSYKIFDKVEQRLSLLKEAVLEIVNNHPKGLRNAEIADKLGIRSDYLGSNKEYLSWSVLGLLLNEGVIKRKGRKYFIH
jgi:hypothetical protein